MTPAKIRSVSNSDLTRQVEKPYGYILVAACDFSKKARDAFRSSMNDYGIEEFHIWGKAELEDMLFQPKNDHLLFAYFGISLKVRRRSVRSQLRTSLSLKRKLVKELSEGDIRSSYFKPVLIRDPRHENYPFCEDYLPAMPPWRYWEVHFHHPRGLQLVTKRCFAYINWETGEWDALTQFDDGMPRYPELWLPDKLKPSWEKRAKYHGMWEKHVPEQNRAWYVELRSIFYERILAVDELGDCFHEGPHLLVEYRSKNDPFEEKTVSLIEGHQPYLRQEILAAAETRVEVFPSENRQQ